MFAKPVVNLTRDDIQRVATEAVLEGPEVEFKETLPSKSGRDPWLEGGDRIGDRARNEILEEIIAFANAFGGSLIIGVAETDDHPRRARAIVPLPRCAELADRLRMQCRDCIEPQIPMIEIAGIPTESDGSGVVVIRTPRSRLAPHRHIVTRECYVRRADRSEKMNMREIQDLTLNAERGLTAIDQKFTTRAQEFFERARSFNSGEAPFYGVRVTLQPLSQIYLDRVFKNESAAPLIELLQGQCGESSRFELRVTHHGGEPKPLIRGVRWEVRNANYQGRREVYCDGLIEYSFLVRTLHQENACLYPSFLMGLVGNSLCAVERFRRAAGTPNVEFGLETEIYISHSPLPVAGYGAHPYPAFGPFPAGRLIFPRYGVGRPGDFNKVVSALERDFWNACGQDPNYDFTIDFDDAFKVSGLS